MCFVIVMSEICESAKVLPLSIMLKKDYSGYFFHLTDIVNTCAIHTLTQDL